MYRNKGTELHKKSRDDYYISCFHQIQLQRPKTLLRQLLLW